MPSQLTQEVLFYQREYRNNPTHANNLRLTELFNHLMQECQLIVYFYPVSSGYISEEEAAELLLSLQPRIKHIMLRFTYTFLDFEQYLRKVSILQSNSLARRKGRKERRILIDSRSTEELETLVACSKFVNSRKKESIIDAITAPVHGQVYLEKIWSDSTAACIALKKKLSSSITYRRNFLQLILLCSYNLHSYHVTFLANILNIDELVLADLISKTIEISRNKISILETYEDHRSLHFAKKNFFVREVALLDSCNNHSPYLARSRDVIAREENLWKKKCTILAKRSNAITHRAVADVLHIPKGTVDSGVQSLKKFVVQVMDD